MHCHSVDEDDLIFEVGELVGDGLGGNATPQPRYLEDVRLVDRRQLSPSLSCRVSCEPDDAPNLECGVLHDAASGEAVVARPLLTEVDTAGEFPEEQDVDTPYQLRPQG